MTADIGIEIKNYEVVSGAVQNEIMLVIGCVLLGLAEDAGTALRQIGSGCSDVLVPPGTPESFHKQT
jgi:hypothetical protein